jgi:hypothetical protein
VKPPAKEEGEGVEEKELGMVQEEEEEGGELAAKLRPLKYTEIRDPEDITLSLHSGDTGFYYFLKPKVVIYL